VEKGEKINQTSHHNLLGMRTAMTNQVGEESNLNLGVNGTRGEKIKTASFPD